MMSGDFARFGTRLRLRRREMRSDRGSQAADRRLACFDHHVDPALLRFSSRDRSNDRGRSASRRLLTDGLDERVDRRRRRECHKISLRIEQQITQSVRTFAVSDGSIELDPIDDRAKLLEPLLQHFAGAFRGCI